MKTRSGLFFSPWAGFSAASVRPVRLKASFAPLLRTATDEELSRSLGLGIDTEDADDDALVVPECTKPSETSDAPAPGPSPEVVPSIGVKRKNQRSHDKRQRDRDAAITKHGHRLPPALHEHFLGIIDRVAADAFSAGTMPFAKNAYTARHSKILDARKAVTPAYLETIGMQRVAYEPGFIRPVVDSDNLVIVCFVDKPRSDTWDPDLHSAHDSFCAEADEAGLRSGAHTRGHHVAVNSGLTVPPGASGISQVKLGPCGNIIRRLVGNRTVARMAIYQSAAFELWAPRLHAEYFTYGKQIEEHQPDSKRNWSKSVFPMACFNLSRNVVCFKHRDVMNVPYGWCAITALGRFRHDRSTCIVLWELNLFFEFPHGTTIYVPSASITHSNTIIEDTTTESRSSFTQYFPGFLARYIDNGFKTDKQLRASDPVRFKDIAAWKADRWLRGLEKLSTLDEVMARLSSASS